MLAGEVPGKDVAARQGYTELIFGENRDIVDTVKEQHVEADRERAQLQTALGRQQALLTTIERYRGQVQDNQRQLESLLSQVQGDLAQAVADADARRQAEDDRKAREAAARQAADFQRQQAAAQQRRSSTTTTLNLDNVTRTSARPSTSTTADDGTPGLPAPSATLPPSTTKAPTTTKPPAPAPPPVVNVPAPNPGAARAVQAAIAQLNKPYKFASADPAVGFDCSGLTSYAWAQAGVGLPHYSKAQWEMVRPVPLDALQPGDLVFFYYPAVSHVGLYIGGGMMVDAQGPGYTVRQASIYGRGLFAAGRPG
jgi:cell wall-associated NlpC family hydrolase